MNNLQKMILTATGILTLSSFGLKAQERNLVRSIDWNSSPVDTIFVDSDYMYGLAEGLRRDNIKWPVDSVVTYNKIKNPNDDVRKFITRDYVQGGWSLLIPPTEQQAKNTEVVGPILPKTDNSADIQRAVLEPSTLFNKADSLYRLADRLENLAKSEYDSSMFIAQEDSIKCKTSQDGLKDIINKKTFINKEYEDIKNKLNEVSKEDSIALNEFTSKGLGRRVVDRDKHQLTIECFAVDPSKIDLQTKLKLKLEELAIDRGMLIKELVFSEDNKNKFNKIYNEDKDFLEKDWQKYYEIFKKNKAKAEKRLDENKKKITSLRNEADGYQRLVEIGQTTIADSLREETYKDSLNGIITSKDISANLELIINSYAMEDSIATLLKDISNFIVSNPENIGNYDKLKQTLQGINENGVLTKYTLNIIKGIEDNITDLKEDYEKKSKETNKLNKTRKKIIEEFGNVQPINEHEIGKTLTEDSLRIETLEEILDVINYALSNIQIKELELKKIPINYDNLHQIIDEGKLLRRVDSLTKSVKNAYEEFERLNFNPTIYKQAQGELNDVLKSIETTYKPIQKTLEEGIRDYQKLIKNATASGMSANGVLPLMELKLEGVNGLLETIEELKEDKKPSSIRKLIPRNLKISVINGAEVSGFYIPKTNGQILQKNSQEWVPGFGLNLIDINGVSLYVAYNTRILTNSGEVEEVTISPTTGNILHSLYKWNSWGPDQIYSIDLSLPIIPIEKIRKKIRPNIGCGIRSIDYNEEGIVTQWVEIPEVGVDYDGVFVRDGPHHISNNFFGTVGINFDIWKGINAKLKVALNKNDAPNWQIGVGYNRLYNRSKR
ncbi:MAG: hypothetical protein ISS82_02695 [Nanoarchaeota archaeon]|nr:hypothetical protein [Nanoarchaeota archaeon]